jgi:hypothetical protein
MTFDPFDTSAPTDRCEEQCAGAVDTGVEQAELSPFTEWTRVHAALLVQERAFARVVARRAPGQASLQEVELAHKGLQALRDLAEAVLRKALGVEGEWSSST